MDIALYRELVKAAKPLFEADEWKRLNPKRLREWLSVPKSNGYFEISW